MRASRTYALGGALALVAVPAAACEAPPYNPSWRDTPIRVAGDCSFTEAGHGEYFTIEASHAQDIGNGRVGQVVSEYHQCGTFEALLVTDCNSGEALLVDAPEGNPPISFGGPNNRHIEDLFRPKGKFRLTASQDIRQLQRQADRHGYKTTTDVIGRINEMKKHNRYDPYCGCALFYPESDGAANASARPETKG